MLAAAAEALGFLSQDYGDAAFAGWAALIFVLLAAIALTFTGPGGGSRRASSPSRP